jgi:hypothetical protein
VPRITTPISSDGPEINVRIRPGAPMLAALRKAGKAVPAEMTVIAVLDTGANICAAIPGMLQVNGFLSTAIVPARGVGGRPFQGSGFEVELAVQPGDGSPLTWVAVLAGEAPMASNNLACAMLLGRDFLDHFGLEYNIPRGSFTLAW